MSKSRSWGMLLALLAGCLLWLWRAAGERDARVTEGGPSETHDERVRADERMAVAEHLALTPVESARDAQRVGEAPAGALTLDIRVLDWNDDRALAGARVTAFDAELRVVRTDADGRCALVVRDVPERLRLRVEADGYVHKDSEWSRREPVEFELVRAARVHGRVLAADTEEPIAGARIGQDFGPGERVVVESGADGSYALAEVPCGVRTSVSLSAAGFATCTRQFQIDPLATDLEQDLHLARGAEVRGRVVDWETGEGLAGALVSGLECDSDGRFVGRLLAAPGTSRARAEVTAAGHASLSAPVELGTDEELEFRVPRVAFVEGCVLDAAGAPLAEAHVFLQYGGPQQAADGGALDAGPLSARPAGWAFGVEPSYERSASGEFRLPVLPWCASVNVRASKDGFVDGEASLAFSGEPATTQAVELRLERARVAGARVGGNVSLNGATSDALRGTLAWRGPTRGGEARFAGPFELVAEPGELELTVTMDDVHGALRGCAAHVTAREGERVLCAFELSAASAPITGRVRFADGRPVTRAELSATCLAREKGWLFYHAVTDARGEYALAVPDVGQRFHVSVVARDEHLAREEVPAGATAIDFVFSDLHPLRVRLVDAATGTTLVVGDAVQLAARAGGAGFAPVRHAGEKPDLDGWSELWLAASRVDLLALPAHRDLAGYGLVLRRDVELDSKDGSVPRVELRLERAAPLVLEFDAKGQPWPEEHELLLLEEELLDSVRRSASGWESQLRVLPSRRRVEFDAHWRLELTGFAPGRYRFVAFPADVALDPAEIVVERGGGPPVLVRWRRVR